MKAVALLGLLLTTLFLNGCEDKQETNLYKAQLCINTATAANVNDCLALIEGQISERAAVLRCSAAFISENIDEDAIVQALTNIDGEDADTNATTPAIASLAMSSTTASGNALTQCTATGADSLIALANFANVATAMSAVLGFTQGATAGDVETLIASYVASGDASTVGAAILASQDSLCNPKDGLFKSSKACVDISNAIALGNGDPDSVGDRFIDELKD